MKYYVLSDDEKEEINRLTGLLRAKHPELAMRESVCTLWNFGFVAGLMTDELFDKARYYYGTLWTYVGD